MHVTFCCLSYATNLEAILAHINFKSRRRENIAELPKSQQYSQAQITPPRDLRVKVTESSSLHNGKVSLGKSAFTDEFQVQGFQPSTATSRTVWAIVIVIHKLMYSKYFPHQFFKHVSHHRHRDMIAYTMFAL